MQPMSVVVVVAALLMQALAGGCSCGCVRQRSPTLSLRLRLRGGASVGGDISGGPPSASQSQQECPPTPRHPRNSPVSVRHWWGNFSAIIDVRTPSEFADDHIPGAVNYPVLNDTERHAVGLTYKETHFEGRRLGAQLISANIAQILAVHLAREPAGFSPLIYCWRGGKRSNSLAHVLSEIGFRTSVLDGGYRAYRRSVVKTIADVPSTLTFRVITGPTGSGKTALLHYLRRQGQQILDLEALANHRGSILGATDTSQPSQKAFESALAVQLLGLRPQRPVYVEDEAAFIGSLHIPAPLWHSLLMAPRYALEVPLSVRVNHTLQQYEHLTLAASRGRLKELLVKLGRYHDAGLPVCMHACLHHIDRWMDGHVCAARSLARCRSRAPAAVAYLSLYGSYIRTHTHTHIQTNIHTYMHT